MGFFMKNSLKVTKNRKKALDTKIVFIKKLTSNSLIINADIKNEIINNIYEFVNTLNQALSNKTISRDNFEWSLK